MICLNKADEGTFRHLAWNQSPPALAADQTTRQDLNGISNLREYVAADQDDVGGGGGGVGALGPGAAAASDAKLRRDRLASVPDAGRRSDGLSSHPNEVTAAEPRLLWASSRLWSWTTWILSVLFFSCLISSLAPRIGSTFRNDVADIGPDPRPRHHGRPIRPLEPPELAGLSRRSTCATGGVDKTKYDIPLHAGALFIIWFVSTLGCAFPLLATKFPGLRIPRRFFFAIRHFGTGVLIATAFVHLLPTAFISLGNPCLGSFWTNDYQAMPGAIALASIFLITVIEMIFHPARHESSPPIEAGPVVDGNGHATAQAPPSKAGHMCSSTAMLPFRDMGPLRGRSSSMGQELSQMNQTPPRAQRAVAGEDIAVVFDQDDVTDVDAKATPDAKADSSLDGSNGSFAEPQISPEMKRRKERLQCILLEMGILFHSVFIGMALSVSIGSDFIVLLIAIVFHQTFEGLALGSRIAAIEWEGKRWQPWLMALAYGCTTPLGQAIGLATHTLYSPDSEVGLIVVGVMNAISAGLLTFASLVELLSEDFLSDESWRYLRGKQRVIACILVFLGAFFMSLVGAWA
ncbi:plasma membrane zinc ion transporter [Drechmeria coniospora]|uniref:Plasma membrane zinc ion transporter n=1 Tax=Drechmeria coniospora TaxID=98403 RepID=A0A151GKI6_DRECN|nr:plasma membrane zinc ion transporter [Drechmeria coniospora]KYK57608.1 plasma membrane zinc ion transporter [Drechmeria coniospora]ODA79497.1 hypothetical protein RJ55_05090 [Drechmeria coniospora]